MSFAGCSEAGDGGVSPEYQPSEYQPTAQRAGPGDGLDLVTALAVCRPPAKHYGSAFHHIY